MLKSTKKFLALLFVTVMLMTISATARAAQVKGAIFTTLFDGSAVNHNIYGAKQDVYLNGGPHSPNAPCTSAGLPDGEYYFQVTDPSGRLVLSTDDLAERRVYVFGGIIAQYLGTTHATGVGKCGGVTVQLFPFNDTPNPGGEYKVWMTPVANFKGFLPSRSKTDNFKAPGDIVLDSDGDGLPDSTENDLQTDPNNPDTDGDGLSDGDEVNDFHTDPLNPDTDNDGLWDSHEVTYGSDPHNSDTDGDGFPDGSDFCPVDPTNTTCPMPG
jgi:hypothetical protein